MIKKITILGVELDNYTVREAIMQVESCLDNQALNTIESVSMQMLIDSENDPVLKEVISSLDLAVIGEKEIIQAAGITSLQRLRETEENDFFYEFFKRMERNKKTLYFLGETEELIGQLKQRLMEDFPKLIMAGEYALENCIGDQESVINEMNAATPDVVVSILPTPVQEYFIRDHKDKMDALIWYGVGELGVCRKKRGVLSIVRSIIHRGKLKSSMVRYKENDSEAAVKAEDEA